MIDLKHLASEELRVLGEKAFAIRVLCLEAITCAGWGHLGGSFSEAELLACLYGRHPARRSRAPRRSAP
jgi:transketolase N-terminal domain/subunit